MTTGKANICEHCGAKVVEYEHTFNRGLRNCLGKLYKEVIRNNPLAWLGQTIRVKDLGLTTSEWTNFAKLRYWDLAEKVTGEKEKHKGGVWRLTSRGYGFVNGSCTIYERAVVCRNVVLRYEGPAIKFDGSVDPAYQHRGDYREQAKQQIQGKTEQVEIKFDREGNQC